MFKNLSAKGNMSHNKTSANFVFSNITRIEDMIWDRAEWEKRPKREQDHSNETSFTHSFTARSK